MYKLTNPLFNQTAPASVIRTTDGACIPFDPDNMDFVEYNKWLSEGNIPLPPDEPTLP
jgi:hypothetical protein